MDEDFQWTFTKKAFLVAWLGGDAIFARHGKLRSRQNETAALWPLLQAALIGEGPAVVKRGFSKALSKNSGKTKGYKIYGRLLRAAG